MPAITVAMITMNEEKAVGKVIDDIRAATAGVEVEILVVDSSRDRTPCSTFPKSAVGADVNAAPIVI